MSNLATANSTRVRFLCKGVVFAVLNSPEKLKMEIADSIDHTVSHDEWYEALLQSHLFAGFPCALEALSVLHEFGNQNSVVENLSVEEFQLRGEKLCRDIYTTAFSKMMERLPVVSSDLSQWMIVDGYGKVLSRTGLDIESRELCIVAMLTALGWRTQLFSHIRGALNIGSESRSIDNVLSDIADYVPDLSHLTYARQCLHELTR